MELTNVGLAKSATRSKKQNSAKLTDPSPVQYK
jgi:hypothetical protein